jgi:hypothetical protein
MCKTSRDTIQPGSAPGWWCCSWQLCRSSRRDTIVPITHKHGSWVDFWWFLLLLKSSQQISMYHSFFCFPNMTQQNSNTQIYLCSFNIMYGYAYSSPNGKRIWLSSLKKMAFPFYRNPCVVHHLSWILLKACTTLRLWTGFSRQKK